jgi:hypothetical protein
MSRTLLQGLEIAGVRIGIEVPPSHRWRWPDEEIARFAGRPRDADVHVGVRVGRVDDGPRAGERYALGPWTFEVARSGDDWILALSRGGRREQVAVFDADFGAGEVVLREPIGGEPPAYPLRGALDEWIVLHRLIASGGVCLHGELVACDGGAEIRLGPDARSGSRGAASARTLLGRDTVWVAASDGRGVRAHPTPWGAAWSGVPRGDVRVDAVQIRETSLFAYRETVDPDEASELLVAHAVVPLGDEALFERVLESARRLGDGVPCRRIGIAPRPEGPAASTGTAWQSGVAPPRGLA